MGVITRAGVPVAEIVKVPAGRARGSGRQFKGKMWISDDFDAPMPEIEELFGT